MDVPFLLLVKSATFIIFSQDYVNFNTLRLFDILSEYLPWFLYEWFISFITLQYEFFNTFWIIYEEDWKRPILQKNS